AAAALLPRSVWETRRLNARCRATSAHGTYPELSPESAHSKDGPMSQNGNPAAIRHGMFIMPFPDPRKPPPHCHDEELELSVKAEELGFSEFWIGEHHTMQYETIVMPEIFIARALGETKTIRMGPAPVCIQQHNPAHVACRLAFLDHLAK